MQNKRVRPVRRLAVAMALTLGLAAVIGAAPSALADAGQAPVAGSGTPVTDQVVLERTGGLIGETVSFQVDAADPHPDAPRLFAVTAGADFLALDAEYLPPITCCDLFSYTVTVSYADGSTKSVLTMDGATAPDLLWDVITLTQAIGGAAAPA